MTTFIHVLSFGELNRVHVQMETSARLTALLLWRKDDKEINKTSETPAQTKKTRKLQELWKDKYKWLRFEGKENKMFCGF